MGLSPRSLPDFPWDSLAPFKARAAAHPDGLVDLSVGTPVDPTPAVIRDALAAAADAPGYPTTHGTAALREAVAGWFARRRGAPDVSPDAVLPTVGSKELVATLPAYLGLGPGDVVVHPRAAYPTYDVGARLAGAAPLATDDVDDWRGNPAVRLVWVNSPSNPTGRVASVEELAEVVAAAREIGALVASDECYAELVWSDASVPSILDPRVCGGSHEGVLAVYSLSKQSNLAGYRAAFVAGDPAVIAPLLEVRKHAGLIVPAPVQAAMTVALSDDAHVAEQKERYRARRDLLLPAVEAAGFRVDHSDAGLYLWATRDEDCWDTIAFLADRGILAAPGAFYGEAARRHVRIALTASDTGVSSASSRLAKRE
ncbi:succinyldiaminopimelate transaminase [Demequina iriomotensis]|uniref:succinyldiaminopimelate transaminase n=1 Tax=Demequina iriomotensis TaxID=1536641 RepID=UPI000786390E|nr:succinyldiaminopimelate transaminase [Demequina iriomotensis]